MTDVRTNPVIAIDGPAGSGKSTLARALAAELALPYVYTGLMYRALTARALRNGLDLDDATALLEELRHCSFGLSAEAPATLTIDARPPDSELTGDEVEASVSRVARHPQVRTEMVMAQRRLGEGGAVMEGRDIGSVVFPDAEVKIFLVADLEARATRRIAERGGREELASALAARDERDAKVNRLEAPPEDAGFVVIDTTFEDADHVLAQARLLVRDRLGARG